MFEDVLRIYIEYIYIFKNILIIYKIYKNGFVGPEKGCLELLHKIWVKNHSNWALTHDWHLTFNETKSGLKKQDVECHQTFTIGEYNWGSMKVFSMIDGKVDSC